MFCENCGKELVLNEKFCTHCGTSINSGIDNKARQSSQLKTGDAVKKLVKFGLWVALIIGGIWLIIALGPLWIIAIILLAILFVVANK